MTLTIEFIDPSTGASSTPNTFYVAGDVIKGNVRFSGRPESVINLKIEFLGEFSVTIYNSNTCTSHKHVSNIFRYPQTYGPGPQACVWPFEFTLPDIIHITPLVGNAPRHVPVAPQPLLPSFQFGRIIGHQSDGTEARIEYSVSANIEYKAMLFNKKQSVKSRVSISAAPLDQATLASTSPSDHTFQLISHRLKPGMEHHNPTAMEKFTSFLGMVTPNLSDPRLLVSLRVNLPNTLPLGSKVPISLSINYLPESSGISMPPPIYLLRIDAKLRILTNVQVEAMKREKSDFMELCFRKWDSKTHKLEYGDRNALDVSEWLSDNFAHDVANQLVPTFSTANLRRYYRIEVDVWLECVGETWRKTFERDVTLLPARKVEQVVAARKPVVARSRNEKGYLPPNAIQEDANYDAPPPMYEEKPRIAENVVESNEESDKSDSPEEEERPQLPLDTDNPWARSS